MKYILNYYAIILMILILTSPVMGQQKEPSVTNKQAKEELKAEHKREKERKKREKAEHKKDQKEMDRLSKDKNFLKRRKKHIPKSSNNSEQKKS